MKKAVALLMALTMSVTALAGCSGGESSKKDEEKSSFKEQAKGEKIFQVKLFIGLCTMKENRKQ